MRWVGVGNLRGDKKVVDSTLVFSKVGKKNKS
jgi:hypothetical protein